MCCGWAAPPIGRPPLLEDQCLQVCFVQTDNKTMTQVLRTRADTGNASRPTVTQTVERKALAVKREALGALQVQMTSQAAIVLWREECRDSPTPSSQTRARGVSRDQTSRGLLLLSQRQTEDLKQDQPKAPHATPTMNQNSRPPRTTVIKIMKIILKLII